MKLVKLSIRRPLTTLMMIAVLIIIGVRAYNLMTIDNLPDIDFPVVAVIIPFRDASPQDVEDLVIEPVEEAVAGISGIDELSATANEGVGTLVITFDSEVDGDQAAIDVEREISSIQSQLPDEADEPSIIKADPASQPILQLVLTGPQSQDRLFQFADEQLTDRLQGISGVASVNVSGGRDEEIEINVDPTRLTSYGLSLAQIQQAIGASDVSFPAGSLEQGRTSNTLRSVSEFETLQDIENVIVDGGDNSEQVYVRNLAGVERGFADETQIIRYNGQDAVSISLTKTSDANTVATADRVYGLLDEVQAELPAGAELVIFSDQSDTIRRSVANVQNDLILAVLITGLVILFFLHTVRTTFIVLLAIPTSIIMTLIVMWGLGFSLNQVTLLALTLIIGNLVDDSIVVLENTERHLEMGKSSAEAAIAGRQEILLASLVIAGTDVVVYLPVAFMSGIAGQIFFPYGVTIATATLCSLFVGFTLTPMLASRWMKSEDAPDRKAGGLLGLGQKLLTPVTYLWDKFTRLWDAGFRVASRLYGRLIRLALANVVSQFIVVAISALLLAAGFYLITNDIVGTEFFPQQDDGEFRVAIEMPAGTNLDTTDQATRWAELLVLENVPETVAILTEVGQQDAAGGLGGGSTASASSATVNVRLVDQLERERSTGDVAAQLRPLVERLPGATVSIERNSAGGPGGAAVTINVTGSETDRLIELANQIEQVMRGVPGVVDIVNTDAARAQETELVVDRELAFDQGLYPADVSNTLRTAVSGQKVGEFDTAGDTEIDITLRLQSWARENMDALLRLPVGYVEGEVVRLGRVVRVQETAAPAVINRTDRQRTLTIEAGAEGRPSGEVSDDVEAAINEQIDFPVGYGFEFAGQTETQREVFSQFGQAIALAVILVYVLMVALYQNWLQPLAIMSSLPVAAVGSFFMLWLTGSTLNLFSILGIILLIGIATKNAILLIDFTNQARNEQGLKRKAALIEAGKTRFRPILMTSMTLIFALTPLLFAQGAGAVNRRPLAAVVVGGAVSSVLLTLILVPVIYNFFDWSGERVTNLARKILGLSESNEEETGQSSQTAPAG